MLDSRVSSFFYSFKWGYLSLCIFSERGVINCIHVSEPISTRDCRCYATVSNNLWVSTLENIYFTIYTISPLWLRTLLYIFTRGPKHKIETIHYLHWVRGQKYVQKHLHSTEWSMIFVSAIPQPIAVISHMAQCNPQGSQDDSEGKDILKYLTNITLVLSTTPCLFEVSIINASGLSSFLCFWKQLLCFSWREKISKSPYSPQCFWLLL